MSATLDDFPAVFYGDPDGTGDGLFTGVMCRGTCGAPCWQPAPAAVAAGETPTFDEVMESTMAMMEGVDDTLYAAGYAVAETLDVDQARALGMVQAAFNGAGMVLNHAWSDGATSDQAVSDFVSPVRDLVRAAGYYLEPTPPRATDPAIRASLERVRALTAQLGAELNALIERTADPDDVADGRHAR